MPRGLSTAIKSALSADEVEFYHLVRFDFVVPLYYTTCPYDIDYDGKTYLSSVLISNIPDVKESLDIKPSKFTISTAGSSLEMQALKLSQNKTNTPVYIYRYMPAANDAILINKGFIDGYSSSTDRSKGQSTISWNISNHWTNWQANNDFILSKERQLDSYSFDVGLEYVSVCDYAIQYWGKPLGIYTTPPNTFYARVGTGGWQNVINLTDDQAQQNIAAARSGFVDSANVAEFRNGYASTVLPVVYGQHLVNGIPVYRAVTNENQTMWVIYAISSGTCDSLVDIYLEDNKSYTDDLYSSNIEAYFFDGNNTTAKWAATGIITDTENLVANWTINHRLMDICCVVVKYTYDEDVFPGGEPQPKFEIKGKKLYDPRSGLTQFSKSSALVLYDYLTNSRYGKGLSASEISGITEAAYYGDKLQVENDGTAGSETTYIKRHEFSGVLSGGEIKKNTETILNSMLAHLVWSSGTYQVILERDDETSTYSIDEDSYKSKLAVSEKGSANKYNVVEGRFRDEDNGYSQSSVISRSDTYLLLDNGRESSLKVNLVWETNRYRATERIDTLMKRSRQQTKVDLELMSGYLDLVAGDIVDLTDEENGFENKLFRVTELTMKADGDIDLELMEYEPSAYDWTVSVDAPLPSNTTLPDPFTVNPPTALTLTDAQTTTADGTTLDRIKISFTAPDDAYVIRYEVEFKTSSDTEYTKLTDLVGNSNTVCYLSNVEYNKQYNIRVRSINGLGRKSFYVSASKTYASETVIGQDYSLDGTDDYKSATFFYHETFNSLSVFSSSGASLLYGFSLKLTGAASLVYAYRKFNLSIPGLSGVREYRFKSVVTTNSASSLGANSAFVGIGVSTGIYAELRWNSSTSKVDVYGTIIGAVSSGSTLIASVNDGDAIYIEFQYISKINATAQFTINGSTGNVNVGTISDGPVASAINAETFSSSIEAGSTGAEVFVYEAQCYIK